MKEFIIENEGSIRVIVFFVTLTIVALFEYKFPKRKLLISKLKRWINNFSLVFLNSLLLKIIFPIAAFGVALFIESKNLGLLTLLDFSGITKILLSIILLDLIIYWQHRLFHKIDFFWKFHKVHHSDLDFDLTTGIRFHPIEIVFSMIIKIVVISLLGTPAIAVIIFEILLSSFAVFNHSNIKLPKHIDSFLRVFIVTPDFHRVHHSIRHDELNSNFGFSISLWDRVFRSYKVKPKDGLDGVTIGLSNLQDENKVVMIWKLLVMPFTNKPLQKDLNE